MFVCIKSQMRLNEDYSVIKITRKGFRSDQRISDELEVKCERIRKGQEGYMYDNNNKG